MVPAQIVILLLILVVGMVIENENGHVIIHFQRVKARPVEKDYEF